MISPIYTIYKATNIINGKHYVGFDSRWPGRKINHKSNYHNKNQKSYKRYFYRAIRKYGWENFSWEPIYQSLDGEHCLKVMEGYFIIEYNSFGKNGYNMTVGGEGTLGHKQTEKTKNMLSLANKGRKRSVAFKKHISKLRKLRSPPNIKNYIVISPTGDIFQVKNMFAFCKIQDLNPYHMYSVASRKQTHYKEWKVIKCS